MADVDLRHWVNPVTWCAEYGCEALLPNRAVALRRHLEGEVERRSAPGVIVSVGELHHAVIVRPHLLGARPA
jgi:hypothetical protein